MRSNRKAILTLTCLLSMLASLSCIAGGEAPKDSTRGMYSLVVQAGGGLSYFATQPGVPGHLQTSIQRVKPSGTLRIMWQPDHRLSVGIESGWVTMYSYELRNTRLPGRLSITAIPVLLEFSMPLMKRFHVVAGAGSYFEITHLSYDGEVSSGSVSLGWMTAGYYTFLSSGKWQLAGELKWMNAAEAQHGIVCLQLQVSWNVISW